MRIRARISIPRLEATQYTKALDEEMEVQIRQAARAWLRAVIPKVPVWAGTARGSLQPLGSFLRVAVPITPLVTRPGLGPSAGAAQGSFSFTKRGHSFVFIAKTDVAHFIQNNFYEAPPSFHLTNPTPWGAFEAGQEAFEEYVRTTLISRIPKIKDYIKHKTVIIR